MARHGSGGSTGECFINTNLPDSNKFGLLSNNSVDSELVQNIAINRDNLQSLRLPRNNWTVKASTNFRRPFFRFCGLDSSSWTNFLNRSNRTRSICLVGCSGMSTWRANRCPSHLPRPLAFPTSETCTLSNSSMHHWNELNAEWRALSRLREYVPPAHFLF